MLEKNFKLTPNHTYFWDGPSVSDIVAFIHGDTYSEIDPTILAKASARGNCVHKQLQKDIYKCICVDDVASHASKALKMRDVRMYLENKHSFIYEWREITCLHNGLIGQIDVLGKNGQDEYIFIDYKTTKTEHREKWKTQLGLYFYLTFGDIWRDAFKKSSFYVIWNDTLVELKIKKKELEYWLDQLELYKSFYNYGG